MTHRFDPKGAIDLEALSPRDANAQRLPKAAEVKSKVVAHLKANKEKDHPPPPPNIVQEPPSSDRPDGAVYQVGKLLGKGGFAICYSSHHLPSRERYALKVVKSLMPPKMEQKFQTELQIHSKMRHRNIVQFHRAFTFHSSTYLVLELCPLGSLMEMVKRRKGLTEPEVRYYTIQIAGAIKYMHSKGVIHRDLKMGNIFLDANMNLKVGDFGLAALLVTGRDMQTIRRTTLCGTPNYIAPEILEKDKQGHDHQVDIWSLGIIVYAMFTSRPPFQSSSTDEIYRRARERDYEWPDPELTHKYISQEAKDLVSTMLCSAEERPEPDLIVQHPFFSSGYMPSMSDITPRLRELAPDMVEFYATDLKGLQKMEALNNLRVNCQDCGVGPYNYNHLIHTPIWKEMAAEEKAGLTPLIPLDPNIVYRPFDETLKKTSQSRAKASASNYSTVNQALKDQETALLKASINSLRQPPQSFAAQQRAQSRPPTTTLSHRPKPTSTNAAVTEATTSAPPPPRAQPRKELPRDRAPIRPTDDIYSSLRGTNRFKATTTKLTTTVQAKEQDVSPTIPAPSVEIAPHRPSLDLTRRATLFSSSERLQEVADTKPDLILERLRRLQGELERALNARSMAIITKTGTPPHPHVVVKWVDYTNKFGLGYILNDGSVGCVLRDIQVTEGDKSATLPPSGVFIRGAESHISRRGDESYLDRNQPVPMTESIKFFENNGEQGLKEASISPETFRVPENADGTAGKMNPGRDIYQHRKRERIILWKKFANYMIAYGRDDAGPPEDADTSTTMSPGSKGSSAELVTFYQRFGDVGCWVFCDGHLQFNFPDHTKVVLDASGTWCHFWHLPEEAAKRLATSGTIGATALDDRAMLSYPLQTLLNFQTKNSSTRLGRTTATSRRRPEIDMELQGIPAANDFRRKIDFIKNVVTEWASNGGLGNSTMDRATRMRWTGYRETTNIATDGLTKQVWVTIGARRGDKRVTTYVNPRKPWELGEDVPPSRK